MDKDILKFIKGCAWLSFSFLMLGGWDALVKFWSGVGEVFWTFFPIFGRQTIEDYLTSPYFIVSIIMFIASTFFGIWFGRKGGKLLYSIIAFLFAIFNLVSLGVNIF